MRGNLLYNLIITAVATAIIVYFYPHPEASQYKFEEGRPWNYAKLIAPFDIPIRPDTATMLAVRDSLNRTFAPVFKRDAGVASDAITALMARWSQQDGSSGSKADPLEESRRQRAIAFIRSAYSGDVVADEYGRRLADGSLPNVRILQGNVVSSYSPKGITYPSRILSDMAQALGADTLAAAEWIEDNDIAKSLVPNLVYDINISDRFYQQDLNELSQRMGAVISGVIQQGQTIIDKGAIITPQDYTNLTTYERMIEEQLSAGDRSMWMMWLGQFLYVAAIMCALLAFIRYSAESLWGNRKAMLFVMLLLTIFFMAAVFLESFIDIGAYITPFAIVPVLLIVFFDAPTAIIISLGLILCCAGAVSFPLEFIVLETLAVIAAAYSLRELAKRSQLLRTSLFVFVSYAVGYVAIEMMLNGSLAGFSTRMIVFLAVSAALASMAYILMVAVERTFGFVSIVTLIELTDTNSPLLRELSQECPGTFQHSMAVSNLATDAALKIKANEQLVRAGALYHDIGKIANPNFFTENQRGVNPHDVLPAEQSARIIISHVTEGLKRADKEGLPSVIKDFISQHHGRGKAKYFYFNYCKQHPDEEVDPAPFTYPGPNPQTREASLLMMADSVEAASRSLKEHTPEAISALVSKIIDGQIADGLHNESPLQFRDVQTIKDAFVRRLMTMYHARIVYPDDPKKSSPVSPSPPAP